MKLAIVFVACVLCVANERAGAQSAPTAEQAAQAEEVVGRLLGACKTAMVEQRTAQLARGTPRWVEELSVADYCDCVGDRLRADLPPLIARQGLEWDMRPLLQSSANHCAAQTFVATFPEICQAMVEEVRTMPGTAAISPQQKTSVCSCIQPRVDSITADTFAPTLQATVRDYQRWTRAPRDPIVASPSSLIGTYVECFRRGGLIDAGAAK